MRPYAVGGNHFGFAHCDQTARWAKVFINILGMPADADPADSLPADGDATLSIDAQVRLAAYALAELASRPGRPVET